MKLMMVCGVILTSWAAPATACDGPLLEQALIALQGGRLVQTELMLRTMSDQCREDRGFRELAASFSLKRGRAAEALQAYTALASERPDYPQYAAGAGRSAVVLGRTDEAIAWLAKATAAGAGWEAWNALGAAYDRRSDWQLSALAYRKALALAPSEPSVLNNFGWSLVLQRRSADAVGYLESASRLAPNSQRIKNNLLVARAFVGHFPDARAPSESTSAHAARLNNAGYAAWTAGNVRAARSLLSRAIEESETDFSRARNNLQLVDLAK
jgi:Flp pilus assembly protein TadD